MKKSLEKRSAEILLVGFLIFLVSFSFSYAAGTGIWKGTQCAAGSTKGGPVASCDFCDALIVANNIIGILLDFSFTIGGVMIVVGGITMIISGGSENNFKKGKSILVKAVTGVAIALVSWIVVGTLIHVLTGNSSFAWNQINCQHNPQPPTINITNNINNNPPVALYAAIANNGIFICSTTQQGVINVPAHAIIYPLGTMPFLASNYCGVNAADQLNKYPLSWTTDWTFAKLSASGQYSCSVSGKSCNDINDSSVSSDDSCLLIHKTQCANGASLYAAIANDGRFACGTTPQNIQGAPENAQTYPVGTMPFLYKDWCNQNAVSMLNQQYKTQIGFPSDYTFAKIASDGKYACSPDGTSCNNINGVSSDGTCLIVESPSCK